MYSRGFLPKACASFGTFDGNQVFWIFFAKRIQLPMFNLSQFFLIYMVSNLDDYTPIRSSAAQIAPHFVNQSLLLDGVILLIWWKLGKLFNVYIFELTLRFKIFVKAWVEKMLESPVHKAPRPDQSNDVHFFCERFASCFHGSLLSVLWETDQFAWQNTSAKLFHILSLRCNHCFWVRFEKFGD